MERNVDFILQLYETDSGSTNTVAATTTIRTPRYARPTGNNEEARVAANIHLPTPQCTHLPADDLNMRAISITNP